MLIFTP